MRILIVGTGQVYSIEHHYIKHLFGAGAVVSTYFASNLFYEYYQKSLVNKIVFRLGISTIYKTINIKFRRIVEYEQPDVIWVFKGMEILPESLHWAKSRRIKLINYNPDNPFIFSGRGSGNKNVTQSIPLYDLHFTYNLSVQKRLEKEFNVKTSILPFGFDIDDYVYRLSLKEPEILRTCFLGNPDRERTAFIKAIADLGIEISVYGHDWRNFLAHPKVEINEAVYGDALWGVLRRYRVQLNLMRVHNLDSHNMRTFEVPGIGGIMVAPETPEHVSFFENGKEAFFFRNANECALIINDLIQLPVERADKIRNDARDRSIKSMYSYQNRAKLALEIINNFVA